MHTLKCKMRYMQIWYNQNLQNRFSFIRDWKEYSSMSPLQRLLFPVKTKQSIKPAAGMLRLTRFIKNRRKLLAEENSYNKSTNIFLKHDSQLTVSVRQTSRLCHHRISQMNVNLALSLLFPSTIPPNKEPVWNKYLITVLQLFICITFL